MKNQEPAGEAQNSQKKAWYTNWWGVIIAFLLLPYFLLYLMWAKTSWNKWVKIVLTIIVVIFTFGAMSDDNKNTENNQQASKPAEQKTIAMEAKTEAPTAQVSQAPQFVFDIPSLIGKNIDEIKSILGKPEFDEKSKLTKQQLELFDEIPIGFTKDDVNLNIHYNHKTKVVTSFFIEGSDKSRLLALGRLQENSNEYVMEFVKNATNPNEIFGVKVFRKLPSELDGSVAYNAVAFQISNNEDYSWTNCRFEINGGIISSGYEYKTSSGIKAKDKLIIPFSEFTKDSERFNFYTQKPEKLFIACDTNGQHRTNYFAIN